MKKAFAYATIAAVLGVVVMLAPFLTIPTSVQNAQTSEGGDTYRTSAPLPQSLAPTSTQAVAKQSESSAGIVPNYPVDTMAVTLILFFSLAVAVSAYFCVRRSRFLKSRNVPL